MLTERVCDAISTAVIGACKDQTYKGRRVIAIDGSTLRMPHTEKNIEDYPQYKNQHGKAHYPLMLIGIVTDVVTGVALRPAYGPYNGGKAVGELTLSKDLIPRLPARSVVLADRYYGGFPFMYQVTQAGHDVLCRLKEENTKRFPGDKSSESGDVTVSWTPPKNHTKKYAHLPPDVAVEGRFIWHTFKRKGFRPQKFFFFTTLSLSRKEVAELYLLRWNIETDLRDIKTTLSLAMLSAKTPDMLTKELTLAIAAYNLIRSTMTTAARAMGVSPRELSFKSCLRRIRILGCSLSNPDLHDDASMNLFTGLGDFRSLTLPKRKTPRPSEPRKKWRTGTEKFMRKSRADERTQLKTAYSE